MQHKARFNTMEPGIGAIVAISGSQLAVGDTLVFDPAPSGISVSAVQAFGLGRLVIDIGDVTFELRPWHKGDGPAPTVDGPSSTWTISGMPNHTRMGA
jgi:hypothetical protein